MSPLAPGVYRREVVVTRPVEARTGVPAFVGATSARPEGGAAPLTRWADFATLFGAPVDGGLLAPAVRAFFAGGGDRCWVVGIGEQASEDARLNELERGLELLRHLEEPDLVAAPDAVRRRQDAVQPLDPDKEAAPMTRLQAAVVAHCDAAGDRFAILDALPRANVADVLGQRRSLLSLAGSSGANVALYHPWVVTTAGARPPSGHVAAVYSRTDRQVGSHKAPANER